MNQFEVTVRWLLRAASEPEARVGAKILAQQGNHPRHGTKGGEVLAVTPLRDLRPAPGHEGDR
jgi:hypothetical protein